MSKKLDLAWTRGPKKLKIGNRHINLLVLYLYFGCKNTKNLYEILPALTGKKLIFVTRNTIKNGFLNFSKGCDRPKKIF